jgi:hypothetical protein
MKMIGDDNQVSLKKVEYQMTFDKMIHSINGHIFAIEISPRTEQAMMAEDWKEMTVNKYHLKLGHVSRLQTIETAKKCGWKIKYLNETFPCEGCQIAKAKILAISKESRN